MKREYDDCIEYLMNCELPVAKVKEELGWAVQYDLSESVFCLLRNGAPHGLRVLCPWTCHSRHSNCKDYSVPLGYYVVCRGWKVAEMEEVLTKGWTPLQAAIAAGDAAAARPLLEAAADTELAETSKPYQASLLHLAVYAGAADLLSELLQVTGCHCHYHRHLLHHRHIHSPPPPPLLQRESEALPVDAIDCFKRTPLSYAACKDEAAMASLLLEHKARVDACDRDGRSALHIAAAMGHTAVLCVLLDAGASGVLVEHNGNTALHYAALEARHLAIVELVSRKKHLQV